MEPASKSKLTKDSTQSGPTQKKVKLTEKSQKSKPSLQKYPFNIKLEHSKLLYKSENDYPDVIKELKQRGWRDSDLTPDKPFYFLWSKSSKVFKTLPSDTIVNHLQNIQELSQKIRLCDNLKLISRSFFPECFHIENGDISEFLPVFHKYSAESILKSSLSDSNFSLYEKNKDLPEVLSCTNGASFSTLEDLQGFLRQSQELDAQYDLRGKGGLWIVKPGWMSRGRGIKVMKDLQQMQEYVQEGPWVIQKYIENPLLVNNRKFDIRQWVLVTSTSQVSAYFYNRCYLRFSCEEYDLEDTENLFVHLTNNSVVKYSKNFKEEDSMWHCEQFEQWVEDNAGAGVWGKIHERIKEIVETTVVAVKEKIGKRRKCFELLGYDFMVDEGFRPWLIEVNSSPAMDYSTVRVM